MTRHQKLILSVVQRSGSHPTAREVLVMAQREAPSVSCSTVYRTLVLLAGQGKLRRIEVPNAPDHFDGTLTEHDHALCPVCGRMVDIELKGTRGFIENQIGPIEGYSLVVRRVCRACAGAHSVCQPTGC